MTDQKLNLDELEALEARATKGPWYGERHAGCFCKHCNPEYT